MRDRRGLRLGRPPDLHREDRLAELERAVGEREEPLRPLEPLDEQHDGVRLGVVEAVREVVAQVEHDLGAHRHDPAVPDARAGRVEERVGHAARLRQARDVAARQPRVDVADVGRAVGRPVHRAHAVGPEQRDAVADRDLRDRALHLGGRLAALDHAAARDHEARHAGVGGLLGEPGRPQRVDGEDRRVRALGQRREARDSTAGRTPRRSWGSRSGSGSRCPSGRGCRGPSSASDERGLAPTIAIERGANSGRRSIGGARHRGRARPARASPSAQPTTAPTPRFSSARATISRWISDVPSQIRSTRSSRR